MGQLTERDKIAHLVRRFGLGASKEEVDEYSRGGFRDAAERLLSYETTDEGFTVKIEDFVDDQGRLYVTMAQWWWILRMLVTKRPLQEKLTLFWHDHFATSASKVGGVYLMHQQNETLRKHAIGKFDTLLLEVSKDPAMLYWLDNQYNIKQKPNENFAREVMELFTLGLDNYREDDIKEIARAFTGWQFRFLRPEKPSLPGKVEYFFRPQLHDTEVKSVLGMHGNWNGDDVCRILAGQPQTSRFLAKKLWEWFVYPEPDRLLIEQLATTFRKKGGDIKELLREIVLHPEFVSQTAIRAAVKNPVDFVIPPLRAMGVGKALVAAIQDGSFRRPDRRFNYQVLAPLPAVTLALRNMGMDLMFPPDVDGWMSGERWITTASMVERMRWADCLYGMSRGRPQMRAGAWAMFKSDPTPAGARKALIALYDATVRPEVVPLLDAAASKASGGTITERNSHAVAASVSKLIFGSPEFQRT